MHDKPQNPCIGSSASASENSQSEIGDQIIKEIEGVERRSQRSTIGGNVEGTSGRDISYFDLDQICQSLLRNTTNQGRWAG
jgi:hypothetical protein